MTLKLDKRIHEGLVIIFTCFTAEDAKKYVGQKGYFANEIHAYQDLYKTDFLTLDRVDGDEVPFKAGSLYFQFFLPAEFVRPVEEKKRWRPFTLEEFRAKFPLLSAVTFRRKANGELRTYSFIGYIASGTIILGNDWRKLDHLFEDYELQDKDGWTPFGVEE